MSDSTFKKQGDIFVKALNRDWEFKGDHNDNGTVVLIYSNGCDILQINLTENADEEALEEVNR